MFKQVSRALVLAIFSCILIAAFSDRAFPFNETANPETDSLNFGFELFNFSSAKEDTGRLDVYLSVVYDDLQFIKSGPDSFKAEFMTEIEILTTDGEPVEFKEFKSSASVSEIAEVNSLEKSRVSRLSFDVPSGDYEVIVSMMDLETKAKNKKSEKITITAFPQDKMAISSIIFLNDIWVPPYDSLSFVPRTNDFQNDRGKIFAYFEVYNAKYEDSLKVHYWITDAKDSTLGDAYLWNKGDGRITKCLIEIDCRDFSHGTFFVKADVEDSEKKLNVAGEFNWFFEAMPPGFADIGQAIVVLKYIGSEEEYKALLEAKGDERYRKFKEFWKKYDPTPTTTRNEMHEEYYRRVAYANEHYQHMGLEGWRTDRGWVYISLGPPDAIERNPYVRNANVIGKTVKAIQAWVYYSHSKSLLFYDDNGFGQYFLANTTTFYDMLRR